MNFNHELAQYLKIIFFLKKKPSKLTILMTYIIKSRQPCDNEIEIKKQLDLNRVSLLNSWL